MAQKLNKIIFSLFISALFFGADFSSAPVAQAALNLNGRILLQVEDQGQAWYVNPLNSQRYYLGRPSDAYSVMRSLGLGVSNADLAVFKVKAPQRLAGRILLQVQAAGEAYYVNPLSLRLYYLGRPTDAFNLMRAQGLGITNADLARIPIFSAPVPPPLNPTADHIFTFKYQNNNYEVSQNLSFSLYQLYQSSPKVYTYSSAIEPPNLREAFYGLFLQTKSGDKSLDELVAKLRAIAAGNNWSDDQLVEFSLALVQTIPYDHAKLAVSDNRNINPYYPYETLYLNRGVCSDKTFLAVVLLRKLGYGAAILDFPDLNHSAVGIACPLEGSINRSGYCYGETTNYFPLGVIPQAISSGQAQSATEEFSNLFSPSGLGKIEIYQKTTGRVYGGLAATRAKVAALKAAKDDLALRQAEIDALEISTKAQETNLSAKKAELDGYYNSGQVAQYNSLVAVYNDLVNQYNTALGNYQAKINEYNQKVQEFNQAVNDFYQK